jgi:hypothetical protein
VFADREHMPIRALLDVNANYNNSGEHGAPSLKETYTIFWTQVREHLKAAQQEPQQKPSPAPENRGSKSHQMLIKLQTQTLHQLNKIADQQIKEVVAEIQYGLKFIDLIDPAIKG